MSIHATDLHNDNHSATYCPEDNKIRIYVNTDSGRVHRETYLHLVANGYKATPKQECNFVATWSCQAEDTAYALIPEYDEIGDEDYSPTDRAADRAERFANYRDKRSDEANDYADRLADSPQGFQSERKAEVAERKQARLTRNADRQWGKAEYWQRRTEGVIGNALHKSDPATRRGRILRLEAEQRKQQKSLDDYLAKVETWLPEEVTRDSKSAHRVAYVLSGNASCGSYDHPDAETQTAIAEKTHYRPSLYDLLTRETFFGVPIRNITPREAAELYLADTRDLTDSESSVMRWQRHYELRLAYERQMLANEGGSVADVEIVPGGWFGSYQVVKVHKSTTTKRPVSIDVRDKEGKLHSRLNIQRLGESAYRAPTPEELTEFTKREKEIKAKAKATAPKTPPLINPTDADAEQLQQLLNARLGNGIGSSPGEVTRLNQATYSANSKGSYSACETVGITEKIQKSSNYQGQQFGQIVMFKVRMHRNNVIVITDKPQKPLPWEACQEQMATHLSYDEAVSHLAEFAEVRGRVSDKDNLSETERQLFGELRYHGLGYSSSYSQWGLSDKGHRILACQRYSETGELTYLLQTGLASYRTNELTTEAKELLHAIGCVPRTL